MSEEQESAEIKTPIFSASMKGKDIQLRDLILLAVLVLVSINAYAFWDKRLSDDKKDANLVGALKEMATSMKEQAIQARITTCLMAAPPTERGDAKLTQCERIAR